jgi:putative ABC transport system substrate-binding protein
MLPDTTAVTSATLEAHLNYSLKQRVPLVTFSQLYLSKGAAASLDTDRTDMGRQAGELATTVLNNGTRSTGISLDPRSAKLNSNKDVLNKLGRKVSTPPPR